MQGCTFTVTLHGTGTPIPCMERFGPSTLVEAGYHPPKLNTRTGRNSPCSSTPIAIGWPRQMA